MIKITIVRYGDADLGKIESFKDEVRGKPAERSQEHIRNFFRPPDYIVLAHAGSKLVGMIRLDVRKEVLVGSVHTTCGMIGGVLVHPDHRMQGIAQMMLKEAMQKLYREKMAFAMLCTDISKLGKLYKKVGFVPLNKPYYFINSDGIPTVDNEGMIASVCERETYELARRADTKINIGPSDA